VKRSTLPQHLRKHGCYLKREGASHSRWMNAATGAVDATAVLDRTVTHPHNKSGISLAGIRIRMDRAWPRPRSMSP
jgi:hypothetical protein